MNKNNFRALFQIAIPKMVKALSWLASVVLEIHLIDAKCCVTRIYIRWALQLNKNLEKDYESFEKHHYYNENFLEKAKIIFRPISQTEKDNHSFSIQVF